MRSHIRRKSLYWLLLRIGILPILLLTLVITIFSANGFADAMNEEVKQELKDLCNAILMSFNHMYEGDYHIEEQDGVVQLFKGEHLLNDDYSIIDEIKDQINVDVTVFCRDVRVATTIKDTGNQRVVSTLARDDVKQKVLEGGRAAYYSKVNIDEKEYFAYYAPLFNASGSCVGMVFVGKIYKDVEELVWQTVRPILFFSFLAMVFAGLFTVRVSRKMVDAIRKTEAFLEKLSGGDLHAEMDASVLKRSDELGEMSRYIITTQKSLQALVEQDILTGLNNRRSGEKLLLEVQKEFVKAKSPYCVVIGDIDYFKYVNDTYGHECGDVVLKEVSACLKGHMQGKGFAARWGGEEFLLVYTRCRLPRGLQFLEGLMEDIRNMSVSYQEEKDIHITMTFGIVEGSGDKINHIIKEADTRLYFGKDSGRNQIVH